MRRALLAAIVALATGCSVPVAGPTTPDDAAIAKLRDGRLDAFATHKAILFEMTDRLPGARVLDGRWGLEHFAAGIPKGRERGLPALSAALAALQADGTVARAVARAGVRGTDAGTVR